MGENNDPGDNAGTNNNLGDESLVELSVNDLDELPESLGSEPSDDASTKLSADDPPRRDEIETQADAVRALDAFAGQTILLKPYAEQIASQFGVELTECKSELRPLSELNRLRPDQDDLAICVGQLAMRIVEDLPGFEAEDFQAGGRGFTQDGRKRENLPKLKEYVLDH